MIDTTDATISISLASYTPQQLGDDLAVSFNEVGVGAEVVRRPEEFTAALEWLVPAAVIVWFSQKFFGTMLEEAGKDSYLVIKQRVVAMVKKISGRDREFDPSIIRSTGKLSEPYANISLVIATLSGKRVFFPFVLNREASSYERAVIEFFRLVDSHYGGKANDQLAELLMLVDNEPGDTVYMRFDEDSAGWRPIDTMVEARKAFERQQAERGGG